MTTKPSRSGKPKLSERRQAQEHEPHMYPCEGPITGDSRGNFTVAFLGCSCGWNKDGKAKDKFSAHLPQASTCEFHDKPKELCTECAQEMVYPYPIEQ